MARARRGARNLVLHGTAYRWRATGDDGFISLVVWPAEGPGATLACWFGYDQTLVPRGEGFSATRQLVITARIVRRVIEYALSHRLYDSTAAGKPVNLGDMSARVDLSDAHRSA
jgi:hypothetical protein